MSDELFVYFDTYAKKLIELNNKIVLTLTGEDKKVVR